MCRRPLVLWKTVSCSWLSANTCWRQMARLLSFLDGFKDGFAYFFLRTMFPIVCQAHIFLIFILHRCAKGLMRSFAWQKNKPDSRGQLAVINVSSFGFEVWISFEIQTLAETRTTTDFGC